MARQPNMSTQADPLGERVIVTGRAHVRPWLAPCDAQFVAESWSTWLLTLPRK